MDDCPFISKCPLADEMLLADSVELIKAYLHTPGVLTLTTDSFSKSYMRKYCRTNYLDCARFKIANNLGFKHLPQNLLPHQDQRAQKIINNHF